LNWQHRPHDDLRWHRWLRLRLGFGKRGGNCERSGEW